MFILGDGIIIDINEVQAVVREGNCGPCTVHLKGGSTFVTCQYKPLKELLAKYRVAQQVT